MQYLVLVLISVVVCKARHSLLAFKPGSGLVDGGFGFAYIIYHGGAISMTTAANISAVKRTSVIFGVLCGGILKKNLLYRLRGNGLMATGAAVITFMEKKDEISISF